MDLSFEDLEKDVATSTGTEVEDKGKGGKPKQPWLKFTQKGQTLRVALLYFHDVARIAAAAAMRNKAAKAEVIAAAEAAITARAKELGKEVGQLSPVDKLNINKAQFRMFSAHYQEGLGYVVSRLGLDGAEADKVWKQLSEPKKYFTTLLLVYPTDRDGNVDKEVLKAHFGQRKFALIPYRFSGMTYDQLWNINDGLRSNDLEISGQDLIVECQDTQYQKVAIRPAGKAIYRTNVDIQRAVLEAAVDKYSVLAPFREMTTDELRAKLGGTSGGNGAKPAAVVSTDFESLLTGLNN